MEERLMEKGLFVVSLDFELFWGLQDAHEVGQCRDTVKNVHVLIPKLLELFEKYGIHATWATVGGILAHSKEEWLTYIPDIRPQYVSPLKSSYRLMEAIGTEEYPEELFFAPALFDRIKNTPGQEIGSHTFSHYYCTDDGSTMESFSADMEANLQIAGDFGISRLKSAVFPKNQVDEKYVKKLKELGFIAYRGLEDNWIHNKIKHQKAVRMFRLLNNYLPLTGSDSYSAASPVIPGLYNIRASRFYRPYNKRLFILEPLKIHRIKGQMRIAAQKKEIYHLWWHPHNFGKNTEKNLQQIESLFSYYRKLNSKYGMQSANMSEIAQATHKREETVSPR